MDNKHVEAATLHKKKTINKGKMKKTIKNTLCRPDPIFWPAVTEEQTQTLESALSMYKIEIPAFKKPHWKELKDLNKAQRPKQPKMKKVEGLIFGKTECANAIEKKECAAVIIDSTINPRILMQPLIEACISSEVPVLCMNGLRKFAATNFGIPTPSLAIRKGYLQELKSKIEVITKQHKQPPAVTKKNDDNDEKNDAKENDEKVEEKIENDLDKMEEEETKQEILSTPTTFTYLYRTSKNSRVFNPSSEPPKAKKVFIGQDYIEFNNKPEEKKSDSKAYMKMVVKRLTNNQNRVKRK